MGKLRPGESASETKAGAVPMVALLPPPSKLSLDALRT